MMHFLSGDNGLSTTQNLKDYYATLLSARREPSSSLGSKIVVSALDGTNAENLRRQFYDFFENIKISSTTIKFHGNVVMDKDNKAQILELEFNKEDFAAKYSNMRIYTKDRPYDIEYKEQQNKKMNDARVNILKELIESQPAGSRKVRIFIGQDLGVSSELTTDFGCHYMTATSSHVPEWIPKNSLMTSRDPSPVYVDINLEEGVNQVGEIIKLRYIISLSISVENSLKRSVDGGIVKAKTNKGFIFIMKPEGATVNSPEYIAYFNHEFIRNSEKLVSYSSGSPTDHPNRGSERIILTSSVGKFDPMTSFDWVDENNFIVYTIRNLLKTKYYRDFMALTP